MKRSDVTFDAWGTRCAAWLYRPAPAGERLDADADAPEGGRDAAQPGVPCVVMAHGFAGVREAGLDRFAERFASAGFAALVFDYRGFGASDGEPRQLLSIPRQLEDWAAAIAFARTLDGVDPERVAAWGTSFSGGHVVATAARDRRLAATIAQVPFADGILTAAGQPPAHALRMTLEALRDALGVRFGAAPRMVAAVGAPGSVAMMTSPDAEPGQAAIVPEGSSWRNEVAARIALGLTFYRPGRRARDVRCPLLVAVCEDDAITPVGPAIRMARDAPRGELVRYADAGHFDVYVGETFERAVTDQIAFLTQHLLAAPAGAGTQPPTLT